MADYNSKYTGTQVDNAVEKCENIPTAQKITESVSKTETIPTAQKITESVSKTETIPTAQKITESVEFIEGLTVTNNQINNVVGAGGSSGKYIHNYRAECDTVINEGTARVYLTGTIITNSSAAYTSIVQILNDWFAIRNAEHTLLNACCVVNNSMKECILYCDREGYPSIAVEGIDYYDTTFDNEIINDNVVAI